MSGSPANDRVDPLIVNEAIKSILGCVVPTLERPSSERKRFRTFWPALRNDECSLSPLDLHRKKRSAWLFARDAAALRGTVELLVLKRLSWGPMRGYGIEMD
jgi:hypothetical protein